MKRLEAVNDFVIQFANVNGSGSASRQRAVRQGDLPHGRAGQPAEHLPSNIQGLPTWYEVRVSTNAAISAGAAASTWWWR